MLSCSFFDNSELYILFSIKWLYKSSVLCYNVINRSILSVSMEKIWIQHNVDYVSAAGFGGFFHNINRIFSIRRRCSVPVEMI